MNHSLLKIQLQFHTVSGMNRREMLLNSDWDRMIINYGQLSTTKATGVLVQFDLFKNSLRI